MPLLTFTPAGIYCPQADVYIDPWQPVDRALITHAHSDHARWGMKAYLAHHDSLPIMRLRLGQEIKVQGVAYGEVTHINGVEVSFHPAGHIIGSAQIRLSYQGETWVVSGDYKVRPDGVATPFEPVPCQHFITESTFGLPVFRWKTDEEIIGEVNDWWASNAAEGKASVIGAYSLGKAQRILQQVNHDIGPVFTHGAVENTNQAFRAHGIELKPSTLVRRQGEGKQDKKDYRNALIIAPPSALGSPWVRNFQPFSLGIASGWMNLRGARRRRAADRGFVLSDHADWDGLNWAIKETGAEHIYVTHGYVEIFSQWLSQQGYDAQVVKTQFSGDDLEEAEKPETEKEAS